MIMIRERKKYMIHKMKSPPIEKRTSRYASNELVNYLLYLGIHKKYIIGTN